MFLARVNVMIWNFDCSTLALALLNLFWIFSTFALLLSITHLLFVSHIKLYFFGVSSIASWYIYASNSFTYPNAATNNVNVIGIWV